MTVTPIIKRFKIKKLFGIYDVNIPFTQNVNIFIGENGLGKTTILNCLSYVIQCDIENLATVDFKEIELTLGNNEKIKISHDELITEDVVRHSIRSTRFKANYDYNEAMISQRISLEIKRISRKFSNIESEDKRKDEIYSYLQHIFDFYMPRSIFEKIYQDEYSISKESWMYKIQEYFDKNKNLIYLPTYRRIEEDFKKYIDNDSSRPRKDISRKISHMQFGMDDVEELINNICLTLKNNTTEGFKEMTKNLLQDYTKIMTNNYENISKKNIKIDANILEIIFSRLSDKIDKGVQDDIISMVTSKKDNTDNQSLYLNSIIGNLIDIYNRTKDIDNDMENFQNVCNHYLVNNVIVYDKFRIECYVWQKYGHQQIKLSDLSSGEKQIISLFSKLYLVNNINNIVLFDEPELSLSILWQEKLIPDIINSGKCSFLFAITHSPFIFNNEYKEMAIDIKQYIKPLKEKMEIA
ncbi:MAG: AAA family ATPase [Candidatus Cloacimonetes bacterium]|nr:AAA family ATPase [Candidatus Cloacimonadota bacterium]